MNRSPEIHQTDLERIAHRHALIPGSDQGENPYQKVMFRSASVPWWLIPNLFALDAPLVACVWQRFLAGNAGMTVAWTATIALASTVWAIYLIDRLLDAQRGTHCTDRHHIAGRNPRLFAFMIVLAAFLALATAAQLPIAYLRNGFLVSLGVAGYLVLVQLASERMRGLPGTKESLVAVGFAAGVAVPLSAANLPLATWLPSVICFGLLCMLNCRLIDRWEEQPRSQFRQIWPDTLLGVAIVLAGTYLGGDIGWALALSTVCLMIIHLILACHPRPARVLADAVLLSPLLFGGVV